jgi:hypothetical protein
MNAPYSEEPAGNPHNRARFEAIFASIWLAVGLFVLPAAIFAVGAALLGPYGEERGLGAFYADFFGDLAALNARAWCLALGPLVLISLLRLIFLNLRSTPREEPAPPSRPAPAAASVHRKEVKRVEPRVSLD